MDDLRIRSFKNELIAIMNREPLPLEIKRLVLSEILSETTKLADSEIKAQIEAVQKEKEKPDPEKTPE